MRRYEEKVVPSTTRTVCVSQECDLCGRKAQRPDVAWEDSGWCIDETEIEVTVRQKEGSSYPEGGSGTKYIIDLCPACFKNKLIPCLQAMGARIEQMEWDW